MPGPFSPISGGAGLRRGRSDVYQRKCELCHSVGGAGGAKKEIGGPLDGVGKKHEAWLTAYLKDPKSKKPDGKMPKMPLSDADLAALVPYLATLE